MSSNSEDMRDEYELPRGSGVRGKYYARYGHAMVVTLSFTTGPSFVASNTSTAAASVGAITKPELHPFNIALRAPAHAG